MAFTTTTLSAALGANDKQMTVASATGFAAGNLAKVGQETVRISKTYLSGTTIPLDGRGLNGGVVTAHVSGENVVTTSVVTDWANAAPQGIVPYPITSPGRQVIQYVASGAITLPTPGNDMIAIILGTSTLAMTLAVPTKDMDGSILYIYGNAKSASAVTVATAIGNAGAGYTVITFQNAGDVGVALIAINGLWNLLSSPITGTSTAVSVAIS